VLRAIATKARTIRLPVHVHTELAVYDSPEQDTLEDLEENFDDARDHVTEDGEQTKQCFTNLQRVGLNEITEIELHHAIGELADTEDRRAGQELDRTTTEVALDRVLLERSTGTSYHCA
jgi:DNA-directed RNA polymerase sigma subunit (sigma70/sigma32)